MKKTNQQTSDRRHKVPTRNLIDPLRYRKISLCFTMAPGFRWVLPTGRVIKSLEFDMSTPISTVSFNIYIDKPTAQESHERLAVEEHGDALSPGDLTPSESETSTRTASAMKINILGEARCPGVLKIEACDAMPDEFEFNWYLDDQWVASGEYFRLHDTAVGQMVRCTMTDASTGVEVTTESYMVENAFQNISEEENINSYARQFGQYSVHSPSPVDRILSVTEGAYCWLAQKNRLLVGGKASHGGTPPAYFANYLRCNGTTKVFTTGTDFAVLTSVHDHTRLLLWGSNVPASIAYPLTDIRAVYANRYAFAFIYDMPLESGFKIGAAGHPGNGGTIPDALHLSLSSKSPKAIYATDAAFAVLTEQGHVFAWGLAGYGGVIDANAQALLATIEVSKIFANTRAFCAVGKSGELVTWGEPSFGGSIPALSLEAILDDGGVQTIVASHQAFCAITKGRQKAISWGVAAHGGTMTAAASSLAARGGIVLCKAASFAFCIIDRSGQAEAWGNATYGGTTVPVSANSGIYGAQSEEETAAEVTDDVQSEISRLFDSGNAPRQGIASVEQSFSVFTSTTGTIRIYANDGGFCILSQYPDGRTRNILCWGHPTYVTLPNPTKQILMAGVIEQVCSSNGAFAALLTQGESSGCVVTWGSASNDGGSIPAAILPDLEKDVVEIYPINSIPGSAAPVTVSGFASRCKGEAMVFWGGAVPPLKLLP